MAAAVVHHPVMDLLLFQVFSHIGFPGTDFDIGYLSEGITDGILHLINIAGRRKRSGPRPYPLARLSQDPSLTKTGHL